MPWAGESVPSPSGGRWYPQINGLVQLAKDDYIDVYIHANDGINTGNFVVSNNSMFCAELVQAT